jgi:hypothetical protein
VNAVATPKLPPPAVKRPKQLGVLVLAGTDDAARRRHELDGQEIVASEAELAVEPATTTTQDEPTYPGGRHPAPGRRKTIRLRAPIEMAHGGAAPNRRRSSLGVHRYGVHPPQVDHEAALREGPASDTVPAAADRGLEAEAASEMNCTYNIMHVGALGDDARSAIDHGVENRPGLAVLRVAGHDDFSAETLTKAVKSGLVGWNGHIHPPSGLPVGYE